ncbi:MAG: hypothetical protein ABR534_08980 [Desulfotignum sp.]
MTTDYTPMWQELGLDLAGHDALLNVLGTAYTDIYLSQKNRPGSLNRSTKSAMNWKPVSRKKPGHSLPIPPVYWYPAVPRPFPTGNCT